MKRSYVQICRYQVRLNVNLKMQQVSCKHDPYLEQLKNC